MTIPPSRKLTDRPDLAQLRRQAKDLRRAWLAGDAEAAAAVAAHYGIVDPQGVALHHAQLVLARLYGFDSWPKLKAHVDGANVERLIDAVSVGDVEAAARLLDARPELVDFERAENDEHRALHYAVLRRDAPMVRLLMEHGADARRGIYPHRDATSALTLARERGLGEIVAIIGEAEAERERTGAAHAAAARVAAADGASIAAGGVTPAAPSARPLEDAVRQGRPDLLAELLARGLDPDEPTRLQGLEDAVYSSGGPLWQCAAAGKHDMAEMLLAAGADPNAMVYASGTPVFTAYGQRDRAMIELLERHGGVADAATLGHYRQTGAALRMLADADAGRLPHGSTSKAALVEEMLWSAACGGDPEIVRAALARTDWRRDDTRWYRVLEQPLRVWNHMGFWADHGLDRGTYQRCFELVLERADANVPGRFGMTILHDLAAARTHVSDAEQVAFAAVLLDAGARLDGRDDLLRSTPLGWACRWGRVELVKLLLERGADPIEAGAEPWATPAAWAAKRGHAAVSALLRA